MTLIEKIAELRQLNKTLLKQNECMTSGWWQIKDALVSEVLELESETNKTNVIRSEGKDVLRISAPTETDFVCFIYSKPIKVTKPEFIEAAL